MANLIQLADYKLYEGLSSTQHDDRLNKIITSVSQLVKTYCGNSIIDYYSTAKTELFNIDWDTHIVQLTESPVTLINSVQIRQSVTSSYTSVSNTDYYIDYSTDSLLYVAGSPYKNWPKGPGAVKVTYYAGYGEVPKDLQLAVVDLVKYYFKDEKAARKTLSGATIENQGTGDDKGFPDHIKRVLDLYKNY